MGESSEPQRLQRFPFGFTHWRVAFSRGRVKRPFAARGAVTLDLAGVR